MLSRNGEILIGDVSFQTRNELDDCKDKYKNIWDNDETYFVAEEIQEGLGVKYSFKYTKLSHCAGVATITK